MKLSELLKSKKTFSFEVFPPKADKPLEPLSETLSRLYGFEPDFISITYGAGGTNKGRSVDVCGLVMKAGLTAMPHFTCIGNTRGKIEEYMADYISLGIENILLLRGDLPEGWSGTRGDFTHASMLIEYFKERHPGISLGAAAYPEVHIESESVETDVAYLKMKQDMGADFFLTQLCHDADAYARFIERIRRAGVTIPVIVGLMPILSAPGTIRMSLSNGCSIPSGLASIIGRYEDVPEDFLKAGKDFTIRLIERYIAAGIDGLHLYTLNKYQDIADIVGGVDMTRFK